MQHMCCYIQDFNAQDHQGLVDGWKDKLVRCRGGDQKWGLFLARKAP